MTRYSIGSALISVLCFVLSMTCWLIGIDTMCAILCAGGLATLWVAGAISKEEFSKTY